MELLTILSDKNVQNTFAIKGTNYINDYFNSTTATTITVPNGARYAIFSASSDFWVSWSGTASVPSANVTDGTGSEINPTIRDVTGVSTFSLIQAAVNEHVSVAFYR